MKKLIKLTESDLHNIIQHTVAQLLTEGDRETKMRQNTVKAILNYYKGKQNITDEQAQKVENDFKEWLFHANNRDAYIRLEPIVVIIALDLGFNSEFDKIPRQNDKLERLKQIMFYIKENFRNPDFPIALNKLNEKNTTYESLNQLFGGIIDDIVAQDRAKAESYKDKVKMNPDYKVIEVNDFDTANYYGNYSCSQSKLCYTQSRGIWVQYTDKGQNRVYLILHKDWQNIQEKHGENTPYDAYGLSMIFVFISPSGEIVYSNTRWNHETEGKGPSNVDQSFTKGNISELLGVSFDSVFKPYTEDDFKELKERELRMFKEAKLRLEQGENPEDIFTLIEEYKNGFARVRLNNKWSFIDKNNHLIGDGLQWFDETGYFSEGFAYVVNKDSFYSYIDSNGKLIGDGNQWFDFGDDFYNGFAKVAMGDEFSFLSKNGKLIGDGNQWFFNVNDFNENGFTIVQEGEYETFSILYADGHLIEDGNLWFEDIEPFYDGYACVIQSKKYNSYDDYDDYDDDYDDYDDENFDYDYDENFDDDEFDYEPSYSDSDFETQYYGYDSNEIDNNQYNYSFINLYGELIGDGRMWFNHAQNFNNGYATIVVDNKKYIMDTNLKFYDYETKKPMPSPFEEQQNESINKLNTIITETINKYLLKNLI